VPERPSLDQPQLGVSPAEFGSTRHPHHYVLALRLAVDADQCDGQVFPVEAQVGKGKDRAGVFSIEAHALVCFAATVWHALTEIHAFELLQEHAKAWTPTKGTAPKTSCHSGLPWQAGQC
jgi:hypothetical protein